MQLRELLGSDVLLEMAYTQKKAERVITALEGPLNDTLLKVWTRPEAPDRQARLGDIIDLIDQISEIVLRPANTRPPHIFYYKLLFFEPFGGGAEVPNMLRRLRRLHRQGFPVEVDINPQVLVNRLQAFHRDLSSFCALKIMRDEQIRAFVDQH